MYYRNYYVGKAKKDMNKECLDLIPTKLINPGTEEGEELEFEDCKCGKEKFSEFIKENKDNIEFSKGEGLMIFIESFGQISAEEILKESIKALKKNLGSIKK